MSLTRGLDPQSRSGTAPTSRQQLPPLSSIFGPPSAARPLISPPIDRTEAFSFNAQNQPPYPQTPAQPVSQPYNRYDSKYETERQQLPALSRTFDGPDSARYPDNGQRLIDVRPEPNTNPRWWHETSRHEHAQGPREPYFRSPHDRYHHPFHTPKEPAQSYSEQQLARGAPGPTPMPATPVAADAVHTKDGLGPKIWTGTHFLPRFLRAAEVPGEGMCYFYDDGSHCKTVIDGEAVNAHWGVTKAGKPRKRLAIACVTCREKKIKCDPDYPRCVQCEKFGRICKFKNAPRGGHNTSPTLGAAELDDTTIPKMDDISPPQKSDDINTHPIPQPVDSVSAPLSPPHASPESPEPVSNKRQKLTHEAYAQMPEPAVTVAPLQPTKSESLAPRTPPKMELISEAVLARAHLTDPSNSDPESIAAIVSKFFAYVNSTMIMGFIPQGLFKKWMISSSQKSAEDLMLLYSVLAVGMLFSGGPKHIAYEYAQVALHAQKNSTGSCLQLAQSRILLALYLTLTARTHESSEMMAAAGGTTSALEMATELDEITEPQQPVFPFGMNEACYSESRRRTMWSLFMLERLSNMFPGRSTMIDAEDIFIRLPADSQRFEKQLESQMPFFDSSMSQISSFPKQPLDMGAYAMEIIYIWSKCQKAIYRSKRRPRLIQAEAAKRDALAQEVEDWHAKLPAELLFTWENLERADSTGNFGLFLTTHLLFHDAIIRLYRYKQNVTNPVGEALVVILHKACDHCKMVFELIACVDRAVKAKPVLQEQLPPVFPMAGAEASEVLVANGPVERVEEMIESVAMTKKLSDGMTVYLEHSSASRQFIDERLQDLYIMRETGSKPEIPKPVSSKSASPIQGYKLEPTTPEMDEQKELSFQTADSVNHMESNDPDIVYIRPDTPP